jgi:hypothetical protein
VHPRLAVQVLGGRAQCPRHSLQRLLPLLPQLALELVLLLLLRFQAVGLAL